MRRSIMIGSPMRFSIRLGVSVGGLYLERRSDAATGDFQMAIAREPERFGEGEFMISGAVIERICELFFRVRPVAVSEARGNPAR